MNRSKWKINKYIIAFLLFIAILLIIDVYSEGIVADFFSKAILEDVEDIVHDDGFHEIRGTFRWDKLRNILVFIAVGGFLVLEAIVYVFCKISKNHERQKLISDIKERVINLKKGNVIENVHDLKLIDIEVKEILNEMGLKEKEKDIEIQKKNDLVTYLAHDLKTPLTTIIGYLNILQETELPDEVEKDYLNKVLKKSYQLEDLTDQFFDISRFNLQEIPLKKNLINGEFFIFQMIDELYPLTLDKKLKFETDVAKGFEVYGDGKLLARVINNLIKNAVNYSKENSIINITAKEENDVSKIIIENDGDVISQQELELIFKKFYRRDKSRNQSSGSGLGLAIAKEIINRHDGSISANSENGHTIFEVCIPKSL